MMKMRLKQNIVILMAPFLGAGGPMQLFLQSLCRPGLHRSSGLQKAQAIRMTTGAAPPQPVQTEMHSAFS
jgi:hypothetical protein